MVDWSELPRDLLFEIGIHLETHFDLLHFRSVCPTWRASVPLNTRRPSFGSRVHFYTKEDGDKCFLLKRTVCLLEFHTEPSQASTTPRFLLGMLEEDEFGKKHILDPLLMVKLKPVIHPEILLDISKLHVQELGHGYVLLTEDYPHREKIAYIDANNPNDNDHFMMLAKDCDSGDLSLFKTGDEELTEFQNEVFGGCVDIIQFKRQFYAVYQMMATVCIEPLSGAPFLVAEASSTDREHYYESFLVESCGKLLLVKRYGIITFYSVSSCPLTPTIRFEVFQLDETMKKWVLLESLGDGILFLGDDCNFSAPAIPGVEGNCIVFTLSPGPGLDRNFVLLALCSGLQLGTHVFDLSSGTTVALDGRPDLLQLFRPPSFW